MKKLFILACTALVLTTVKSKCSQEVDKIRELIYLNNQLMSCIYISQGAKSSCLGDCRGEFSDLQESVTEYNNSGSYKKFVLLKNKSVSLTVNSNNRQQAIILPDIKFIPRD